MSVFQNRFSQAGGISTAGSRGFGNLSTQSLMSAGVQPSGAAGGGGGGLGGLLGKANPIAGIAGGVISGLSSLFAGRQLNKGLKQYNTSLEEDQRFARGRAQDIENKFNVDLERNVLGELRGVDALNADDLAQLDFDPARGMFSGLVDEARSQRTGLTNLAERIAEENRQSVQALQDRAIGRGQDAVVRAQGGRGIGTERMLDASRRRIADANARARRVAGGSSDVLAAIAQNVATQGADEERILARADQQRQNRIAQAEQNVAAQRMRGDDALVRTQLMGSGNIFRAAQIGDAGVLSTLGRQAGAESDFLAREQAADIRNQVLGFETGMGRARSLAQFGLAGAQQNIDLRLGGLDTELGYRQALNQGQLDLAKSRASTISNIGSAISGALTG